MPDAYTSPQGSGKTKMETYIVLLIDYVKHVIEKRKNPNQDEVLGIIKIDKELEIEVSNKLHDSGVETIKQYYDDCCVLTINGKATAFLRNKKNPAVNCVIYNEE